MYGARGVALKLCCRNSLDLSACRRGWNRWGVQNWQGKKHDATRTRHVLVRADYGGRHGFGTQPAKKSKVQSLPILSLGVMNYSIAPSEMQRVIQL